MSGGSIFPYVSFMSVCLCFAAMIVKKMNKNAKNVQLEKESQENILPHFNLVKKEEYLLEHVVIQEKKDLESCNVSSNPEVTLWGLPSISEAIPRKKENFQSQLRKIGKDLRQSKKELEEYSSTSSLENLEDVCFLLKELQEIMLELKKMSSFEGKHDTEAVMVMEMKLPGMLQRGKDLEKRISVFLENHS